MPSVRKIWNYTGVVLPHAEMWSGSSVKRQVSSIKSRCKTEQEVSFYFWNVLPAHYILLFQYKEQCYNLARLCLKAELHNEALLWVYIYNYTLKLFTASFCVSFISTVLAAVLGMVWCSKSTVQLIHIIIYGGILGVVLVQHSIQ